MGQRVIDTMIIGGGALMVCGVLGFGLNLVIWGVTVIVGTSWAAGGGMLTAIGSAVVGAVLFLLGLAADT